jgi:acetolactate synthase-1/2/3 large subunit
MASDTYRIADCVIDFLVAHGVKHVFMLPGGGAMFLNDALTKNHEISAVPCLHEQAAAIAAEAYSRISGSIGVAMVTTGPGATNAITGLAGAWIESVPLLIISGQVKSTDLIGESGLRQRGVQEVDIVSIVKPITKYAKTVLPEDDIVFELNKALEIAVSGRAGPVWIDIPLDVQAKAYQSPDGVAHKYANSTLGSTNGYGVPDCTLELNLKKIESLLAESERPVFLLGHGTRLSGAVEIFRKINERFKIPTVMTWNAMDILAFDNELCIGRPGTVAMRSANFAVQNCDLLISIGSSLNNIVTAYNPQGFARSAKKIIVDVDEKEINKLDINFELKVNMDAKVFLTKLQEVQKIGDYSKWLKQCGLWKLKYSNENPFPKTDLTTISHFEFVKTLSKVLPADMLICTGSSGLAVEFFYTFFENKIGQRIFLTSGLGSMGYGLPAAIGACFANNKLPMLAIESDGSLQLNIQELATLRAFNLPIKLVIMNNGGYASIRNTQRNYFNSRFIGTGVEAGMFFPSLLDIAAAYQIPYFSISKSESLEEDLKSVLSREGPVLIDIQLEHSASLGPKVASIPKTNGQMSSMPLEDMHPLLSIEELKREMLVPLTQASYEAREKI